MPPADPLAASRTSRFRLALGAAVVLLLVGIGVTILVATLGSGAGSREYLDNSTTQVRPTAGSQVRATPPPGNPGAVIYVHVLGAVNKPGLYGFRDGDRAIDAVAAAGGYTEVADRRSLNLARFLADGEQIVIPTHEESASGSGASASAGGSASGSLGGKVNLNSADAAALESLPRVGPSLAARIIAWRVDNGRFTSVEDLMSVTGIGDKTFAGLKDLVTI